MMPFLRIARDRVGVDLGHDQRHVGVYAPVRGIVDHDARRRRRSSATIPSTPVEPADIRQMSTPEKSKCSSALHLERLVAEGDFDALAAARGERDHLVGGKRPLGEDVQHFAADIAGRADDGDLVTHCSLSGIALPSPPRGKPRLQSF